MVRSRNLEFRSQEISLDATSRYPGNVLLGSLEVREFSLETTQGKGKISLVRNIVCMSRKLEFRSQETILEAALRKLGKVGSLDVRESACKPLKGKFRVLGTLGLSSVGNQRGNHFRKSKSREVRNFESQCISQEVSSTVEAKYEIREFGVRGVSQETTSRQSQKVRNSRSLYGRWEFSEEGTLFIRCFEIWI